VGKNIFLPQTFVEFAFRNFGPSFENSEELTLRNLDSKLGYDSILTNSLDLRLQTGLSLRYIALNSLDTNFSYRESGLAFLLSAGTEWKFHENGQMLFDISARSPLSSSADKGSLSMTLALQVSL
jgi:hypothetical protein